MKRYRLDKGWIVMFFLPDVINDISPVRKETVIILPGEVRESRCFMPVIKIELECVIRGMCPNTYAWWSIQFSLTRALEAPTCDNCMIFYLILMQHVGYIVGMARRLGTPGRPWGAVHQPTKKYIQLIDEHEGRI